MDAKRYNEIRAKNEGVLFSFQVTLSDILLLHGALTLAMKDPKVKTISPETFRVNSEALTEAFHIMFKRLGLTKEEIQEIGNVVERNDSPDEEA